MKMGDKVIVKKGPFAGKKAMVVKAFNCQRIDGSGTVPLVAIKLESGSNIILKASSVETSRSIASLLDYGLHK